MTEENTEVTETPPPKGPGFAELGLRPEVLRAITDMGFTEPMEVQAATIPRVRAGRDLMVQSRTGSGKTAAFGIPLVDWIVDPEAKYVQAIVLMPTRELALQVAAEVARIATHAKTQVVPVYGGAPMGRQIEQLRAGGQIVCGTPGRVLDHIRRGTLKLDRVRCAVLDECDEMLSMGFQEDIEAILERTPSERQTLLFSATVPEGIQRLSRRFLRDPEFVKLSADFVGVHEIRHVYYSIPGGNREAELQRVLQYENPERAIIFCNTREETGRVAEYLRRQGYDAEAISSDLSQSDRERVMGRMRAHEIRFLVATDVAARGIDLENLPCVINYTIPESPEVYIHRTGRTGRAGRHGTAISLIGPAEVGSFYYVKLLYKIKPEERSLPSEAEIRSKREGERILQLRGMFPADPGPEWRSLARRLLSALDGERLVAALLAETLAEQPEGTRPARAAREEAPAPARRPARDEERPGDRPRANGGRERDRERERDRDRERAAGGGRDRDRDRDRDRARRDRGDRGGGRREREGRGRPERPARGATPERRDAPAEGGREFWEVWSEETGRTPAASPPPEAEPSWSPDEAAAAPESGRTGLAPGQVRLYLNLGRKDGATVEEIAGLMAAEGVQVPPGEIELMNTHSYLNVGAAEAERLCVALTDRERDGRKLLCEPARPPKRR